MKKIIMPYKKNNGRNESYYPVHIKIEYESGKLSISGVEGALSSGDCRGSAGQINMSGIPSDIKLCKDWTTQDVKKLFEIWERWHLNNLKAGTPEQEDFIRTWGKDNKYDYTAACEALKAAGLYEVIDENGQPYKYGHSWKKEEVPAEVIDWLFARPSAEKPCAWHSL